MATGLATTGTVIGSFFALLEGLQSFEQGLGSDEEDQSNLNRVIQALAVQRNTFEDTTLELLCDILPPADIGVFIKSPGGVRWQEATIQVKANERLGTLAETYWGTCAYIQTALVDIKQDIDNVPNLNTKSAQLDYSRSLEWKALVRRLWQGKNIQVLTDLKENNQNLKTSLDQIHQERNSRIEKANADLNTILGLVTPPLSAEATKALAEICLRVQQDEECHFKQPRLAAVTIEPSLQCCWSNNATCLAGSTTPYNTRTLLRLRWAIVHLPHPADFKPEKCCSSKCPIEAPFPSLTEFLAHFVTCQYANTAAYPCLLALERAWYDNSSAWRMQPTLSPGNGVGIMSGSRWPSEYKAFKKKQPLPLETYDKWGKLDTGNSKLDAVMYQGVILVRKVMTWKTQFELDEFQEESKNLQHLNHFHIIQYFGSYIQPPSFAILLYPLCEYNLSDFMKFCEDEDIQEVLSDPELLLNRLYLESFFPCLAQALKFIHNHTTRHADIKPANIVIKKRAPNVNTGRHYHIYIADFGSSSTYSYISQTTRFVAKTEMWCAPEVASNSSAAGSTELKKWGRPADVFSLGCVYAEMLTVLACEDIISFDSFRAGNISLAKEALPRERGRTANESFQGNLPRVGEWLQNLRRYEDADTVLGRGTRGYWYRRGNRVAFAPWKNTFAETIDITESMLRHDQDARPKIAEVVKRLGVDDCCNREIVPLYAYSNVNNI